VGHRQPLPSASVHASSSKLSAAAKTNPPAFAPRRLTPSVAPVLAALPAPLVALPVLFSVAPVLAALPGPLAALPAPSVALPVLLSVGPVLAALPAPLVALPVLLSVGPVLAALPAPLVALPVLASVAPVLAALPAPLVALPVLASVRGLCFSPMVSAVGLTCAASSQQQSCYFPVELSRLPWPELRCATLLAMPS
jgi:hypothetical protein